MELIRPTGLKQDHEGNEYIINQETGEMIYLEKPIEMPLPDGVIL